MRNYANLSAYDFELLMGDLLSAEIGTRFEAFAEGADQGIDLRATTKDGLVIAQCKHLMSAGADAHEAAKKELPKLEALNPKRYIFATTANLSPQAKDKIKSTLAPYIKFTEDIIGRSDLELLLNKHSRVDEANPKLWLSSSKLLETLRSPATTSRTRHVLAKIQESLKTHVATSELSTARNAILGSGCCVIQGPAGAGKTTMAYALIAWLSQLEYKPFVLSSDIDEAFSLHDPSTKQVFFYDDFLGRSTSAELLGKNEDSRIADFIELSRSSTSLDERQTIIIMTTRDYIWTHGKKVSPRLASIEAKTPQIVLKKTSMTVIERAHLVLNHLHHSSLDVATRMSFQGGDWALQVVRHKNFSPRLVAMFFNAGPNGSQNATSPQSLLQLINNPFETWGEIVADLPPEADLALQLLSTLPAQVDVAIFLDSLDRLRQKLGFSGSYDRVHILRLLEGSFLTISENWGRAGQSSVGFINPSVADFARDRLVQYGTSRVLAICETTHLWSQLAFLGEIVFRGKEGLGDIAPVLAEKTETFATAAIRCFGSNEHEISWRGSDSAFELLNRLHTIFNWGQPLIREIERQLPNAQDFFDNAIMKSKTSNPIKLLRAVAERSLLKESDKPQQTRLEHWTRGAQAKWFKECVDPITSPTLRQRQAASRFASLSKFMRDSRVRVESISDPISEGLHDQLLETLGITDSGWFETLFDYMAKCRPLDEISELATALREDIKTRLHTLELLTGHIKSFHNLQENPDDLNSDFRHAVRYRLDGSAENIFMELSSALRPFIGKTERLPKQFSVVPSKILAELVESIAAPNIIAGHLFTKKELNMLNDAMLLYLSSAYAEELVRSATRTAERRLSDNNRSGYSPSQQTANPKVSDEVRVRRMFDSPHVPPETSEM